MHLIEPRHHSAALRLMVLWGAVTGGYLAAVFYRLIALQAPVALPTYAALSAVVAVWFALVDALHPRHLLRAGAVTSLVASIAVNTAIISRSFMTGRALPLVRIVFTVLLLAGLLGTTRHAERQNHHEDGQ